MQFFAFYFDQIIFVIAASVKDQSGLGHIKIGYPCPDLVQIEWKHALIIDVAFIDIRAQGKEHIF